MTRSDSRLRTRGMTLIEVLTVVAVMAIVTAAAAPGMRSFGISQRAKSMSFDLVSDLLVARSEALKRNRVVNVIPNSGDWARGWTVTSGTITVLSRSSDAGSLSFESAPSTISFNTFGRIASPADPVRITVKPADASSDAARRCVELDPSGYARSKLGAC